MNASWYWTWFEFSEICFKDKESRKCILEKILKDSAIDFDIEKLATVTQSMSGSDLFELCRAATLNSLNRLSETELKMLETNSGYFQVKLTFDDFKPGLKLSGYDAELLENEMELYESA